MTTPSSESAPKYRDVREYLEEFDRRGLVNSHTPTDDRDRDATDTIAGAAAHQARH